MCMYTQDNKKKAQLGWWHPRFEVLSILKVGKKFSHLTEKITFLIYCTTVRTFLTYSTTCLVTKTGSFRFHKVNFDNRDF